MMSLRSCILQDWFNFYLKQVLISVCGASTANIQCLSNGPYSQLKDSVLLDLITLLKRLVYH